MITKTNIALVAVLATSMISQAQQKSQPQPAYSSKTLITGSAVDDRSLSPNAVIDVVTVNDTGEVAFIAHWTEGNVERTGVFTSKGTVVREGDLIGEKSIASIIVSSLAINHAGQVAYEAGYSDRGGTQGGVFVDKRFLFTLCNAGKGGDFTLTNDGTVLPRPGVACASRPTPQVETSQATQQQPCDPKAANDVNRHVNIKRSGIFGKMLANINKQVSNATGGIVTGPDSNDIPNIAPKPCSATPVTAPTSSTTSSK
jgi:hypothetical protein